MTKTTWIAIIVIILLIAGGWYWSTQNNAPVDNGIIKVGVIAPLTGQYGFLGEGVKNAVLMALDDPSKFNVIVEDDAFDATKGVSAYHKLIDVDKVDTLVVVGSPTLSAIQPLVVNTNMPVFEVFESNFHDRDNVFQVLPFSYPLFTSLAKEADSRYNKIALVYSGAADIFTTNADYFKQGINSSKIVLEDKLGADPAYKTEVTKILAAKPDAVTLMMAPEEGIKFIQALIAQGGKEKVKLICDANIEISIQQYINAVGADIFDGCISTNLPSIVSEEFSEAYKDKYGAEPPLGSTYSYDAATIIKNLSNVARDQWLSTIQATNIDGVSGPLSFDENGTRSPQSETHIFKNGEFVKLEE